MNLGYLIQNAVSRFADRIAVSDGKRTLTYRQLVERINRLGNGLTQYDIKQQDRIASLQYNSIEALEFELMAAQFGYVRTLLNARGGMEDHVHALSDCKASVLVFGAEFTEHVTRLRHQLPSVQAYVCVGDGPDWAYNYEELLARAPTSNPKYEVRETDWHSIYYTSGTTGKPKGVVLNQHNWLVLVRNHLIDVFPAAAQEDVLLHAAPMSHASGTMIFAHLIRGARQHVQRHFDAEETLDLFEREGVTTVYLAPTMIIKLMEQQNYRKCDGWRLHTVRYGAAPMAAERLREAVERWGPVFVGGYGQWEAPQMITVLNQRQHAEAIALGKVHRLRSCGVPLSFVRAGIMDDEGNLLDVDQEGEVVTAGDHLMVGYLNRSEETAALRHGLWQRTGDIGRLDADGFLYLTDRKKDLIITGGNNVYPREVEEIVYSHPDVLEAAVIGIPDDIWGEIVHVEAVLRRGSLLDPKTFLDWCHARLPADKRPRSVKFVSDLPKSAYGKILRREVRDVYWVNRASMI